MVHLCIRFVVKKKIKKKNPFHCLGISRVPCHITVFTTIPTFSTFHLNTGHVRHHRGTFAGWWRPWVCSCRRSATTHKAQQNSSEVQGHGAQVAWLSAWSRRERPCEPRQRPSPRLCFTCLLYRGIMECFLIGRQSVIKYKRLCLRRGKRRWVLGSKGRDGGLLSSHHDAYSRANKLFYTSPRLVRLLLQSQ